MTDILQSVLPSNCNDTVSLVNEKSNELIPNYPPNGYPPNVSGQTLIIIISLKYIGMSNKSKQEGCHIILQEPLYHTDCDYIKIHLEKYDT